MRTTYRVLLLIAVSVFSAGTLLAQRNELAITGGGYFPTGTQADLHTAAVVEGSFAHRIFSVPMASIYVEVPVARTFDVGFGGTTGSYTGTFVVPGLKLKLAPGLPWSPFFVAGVGVAHYSTSNTVSGSQSKTSGAFDIGGGLDVKIFPFVSLRGELRDVYSSGLHFALPGVSGNQHNLLATGGLVLRF